MRRRLGTSVELGGGILQRMQTSPAVRRTATACACGALVLLTFLAYQPAWRGQPIFDDEDHFTPPELSTLEGLGRIWTEVGVVSQYYPVTHTAFWIQQKLWGDNMLGYHWVNLALHAGSALLLVALLRRLEVKGAWLAGAIFAFHPVHVESVAWISELKNTLSGFFYLASAWAYLNYANTRRWGAYVCALMLFVVALLSKTVVASLPAALLVVFWWKRGRLHWRDDVRPLLPFFALSVCAGLLTIWVERTFIGASGDEFDLSLVERTLLAGRVVWFYASKVVWPQELIFIYPRWTISASELWQYVFPATALVFLGIAWKWRHSQRAFLASLLLFGGTLVPVLGFLNVYPFIYSYVADHYQYLASVFVIVPLSAALAKLWHGQRPAIRAFAAAVIMTVPLFLLGRTWLQSRLYRDDETLWRATLAANPDCFLAHANLANRLLERGDVDAALPHALRAVEQKPRLAQLHNNVGNVWREMGNLEEARKAYQQAVALQQNLAPAHYNLGLIALHDGRAHDAEQAFRAAVNARPEFVKARVNLSAVLLEKGEIVAAQEHLRAAEAIRPNDPEVKTNLGNVYLRRGDVEMAVKLYQQAMSADPAYALARFNHAVVLLSRGELTTAISELERVVALEPAFTRARYELACAFLEAGAARDAVSQFDQAISVSPHDLDLHAQLAWLLSTWPGPDVRDGARALRLALRAVELGGGKSAMALRSLGAAHAECGEFLAAEAAAAHALALAEAGADTALIADLRAQITRYRAGLPVRGNLPSAPLAQATPP
jgi:protein O-mannosyl-transferase